MIALGLPALKAGICGVGSLLQLAKKTSKRQTEDSSDDDQYDGGQNCGSIGTRQQPKRNCTRGTKTSSAESSDSDESDPKDEEEDGSGRLANITGCHDVTFVAGQDTTDVGLLWVGIVVKALEHKDKTKVQVQWLLKNSEDKYYLSDQLDNIRKRNICGTLEDLTFSDNVLTTAIPEDEFQKAQTKMRELATIARDNVKSNRAAKAAVPLCHNVYCVAGTEDELPQLWFGIEVKGNTDGKRNMQWLEKDVNGIFYLSNHSDWIRSEAVLSTFTNQSFVKVDGTKLHLENPLNDEGVKGAQLLLDVYIDEIAREARRVFSTSSTTSTSALSSSSAPLNAGSETVVVKPMRSNAITGGTKRSTTGDGNQLRTSKRHNGRILSDVDCTMRQEIEFSKLRNAWTTANPDSKFTGTMHFKLHEQAQLIVHDQAVDAPRNESSLS
jgi:hypothetical protein